MKQVFERINNGSLRAQHSVRPPSYYCGNLLIIVVQFNLPAANVGTEKPNANGVPLYGQALQRQFPNAQLKENAEAVSASNDSSELCEEGTRVLGNLPSPSKLRPHPSDQNWVMEPNSDQFFGRSQLESISGEDSRFSRLANHHEIGADGSQTSSILASAIPTVATITSDHIGITWPTDASRINPLLDFTEVCLLRYFVEELAQWVG